jgi:hypothetical protein
MLYQKLLEKNAELYIQRYKVIFKEELFFIEKLFVVCWELIGTLRLYRDRRSRRENLNVKLRLGVNVDEPGKQRALFRLTEKPNRNTNILWFATVQYLKRKYNKYIG